MRSATYWHVAKRSVQEHLEYRLNLGLEVAGGVLTTLVLVWLWRAIAQGQPLGQFTLPELVTYVIGAGLITGFLNSAGQGDSINDDINRGFLSSHLVKPIDPLWYWLTRDLTRKVVSFGIAAVGFLLIGGWYRALLVPPASTFAFVAFACAIVLAALLHFLLYAVFALAAFWVEQTWGERFVIRVATEFFSGALMPLTLFPAALLAVAQFLPFRFFAHVPMGIYLGTIDLRAASEEFFVLGAWIAVLYAVARVMLIRGIRRYAGEGL